MPCSILSSLSAFKTAYAEVCSINFQYLCMEFEPFLIFTVPRYCHRVVSVCPSVTLMDPDHIR